MQGIVRNSGSWFVAPSGRVCSSICSKNSYRMQTSHSTTTTTQKHQFWQNKTKNTERKHCLFVSVPFYPKPCGSPRTWWVSKICIHFHQAHTQLCKRQFRNSSCTCGEYNTSTFSCYQYFVSGSQIGTRKSVCVVQYFVLSVSVLCARSIAYKQTFTVKWRQVLCRIKTFFSLTDLWFHPSFKKIISRK